MSVANRFDSLGLLASVIVGCQRVESAIPVDDTRKPSCFLALQWFEGRRRGGM